MLKLATPQHCSRMSDLLKSACKTLRILQIQYLNSYIPIVRKFLSYIKQISKYRHVFLLLCLLPNPESHLFTSFPPRRTNIRVQLELPISKRPHTLLSPFFRFPQQTLHPPLHVISPSPAPEFPRQASQSATNNTRMAIHSQRGALRYAHKPSYRIRRC